MNQYDLERVTQSIREEFKKNLEEKTGWGRNEALMAFDRALITALIKQIPQGSKVQ